MNTEKKDIDLFIDAFSAISKCNSTFLNPIKIDFPDFVTVDFFGQVHFYNDARKNVASLAKKLHSSIDKIDRTLEIKEYTKILKQAIAEVYATNSEKIDELDFESLMSQLKEKIDIAIDKLKIEITHHFSYISVGFELNETFNIGPVKFSKKEVWIKESNFSEMQKSGYSQEEIKNFLLAPNDENFQKLDFSLQAISSKFEKSRTIASTKIKNREFNISKKIAKITTKSALDAMSLLLGSQRFFMQNLLTEDTSPKGSITSVSTQKDFVYFSGSSAGKNIPIHSTKMIKEHIDNNTEIISAFEFIIDNFSMDRKGKYPNLCHRWISSLDWFSEGCREENDSIAVTKMATALDVLACSGNSSGTLDTIVNLTGYPRKHIFNKENNASLESIFKSFYSEGRSKIVHGALADRFQDLEEMKNSAFFLTRFTLIRAALLLHKYQGNDKSDAFKTMGSS